MAPVHDTDLAEERWSQAEWEHYELWEKIEIRLRRRRWLWIALTALVFLALSSIPIVVDRAPKWSALALTRRLSEEIISLKRETAEIKQALRLRFTPGTLQYVVEKAGRCSDSNWTAVRQGTLASKPSQSENFTVITPQQAGGLDLPGLLLSFCYDPLIGNQKSSELAAFGVIPVKDLAELRPDRVSLLLLKGESAEISFE